MTLYGQIVLIKRTGEDGSCFPVLTKSCKIGSGNVCDIRVQRGSVSKEHCIIEAAADKQVWIRNLTRNITLLNGVPLTKEGTSLKHKDIFVVSDRSFRWEYMPGNKFYCVDGNEYSTSESKDKATNRTEKHLETKLKEKKIGANKSGVECGGNIFGNINRITENDKENLDQLPLEISPEEKVVKSSNRFTDSNQSSSLSKGDESLIKSLDSSLLSSEKLRFLSGEIKGSQSFTSTPISKKSRKSNVAIHPASGAALLAVHTHNVQDVIVSYGSNTIEELNNESLVTHPPSAPNSVKSTRKTRRQKNVEDEEIDDSKIYEGVNDLMKTPCIKPEKGKRKSGVLKEALQGENEEVSETLNLEPTLSACSPSSVLEDDFDGLQTPHLSSAKNTRKANKSNSNSKMIRSVLEEEKLAVKNSFKKNILRNEIGKINNSIYSPSSWTPCLIQSDESVKKASKMRNIGLNISDSISLSDVSNLMQSTPAVNKARHHRKTPSKSEINAFEVTSPFSVQLNSSMEETDISQATTYNSFKGDHTDCQSLDSTVLKESAKKTKTAGHVQSAAGNLTSSERLSMLTPAVRSGTKLRKARKSEVNTFEIISPSLDQFPKSNEETDISRMNLEKTLQADLINFQSFDSPDIRETVVSNVKQTPKVQSARKLRKARRSEVNTFKVISPTPEQLKKSGKKPNISLVAPDETLTEDLITFHSINSPDLREVVKKTPKKKYLAFDVDDSTCMTRVTELIDTPSVRTPRSILKTGSVSKTSKVKSPLSVKSKKSGKEHDIGQVTFDDTFEEDFSDYQSLDASDLFKSAKKATTINNVSSSVNDSVCLDQISNLMQTPTVRSDRRLRKSRRSEVNTFKVISPTLLQLETPVKQTDCSKDDSNFTVVGTDNQLLNTPELWKHKKKVLRESNIGPAINDSVGSDKVGNLMKTPMKGDLETQSIKKYTENTQRSNKLQSGKNDSIHLEGVSDLMQTPVVKSSRSLRKSRRSEVNTFTVKSPTSFPLEESVLEVDASMAVSETRKIEELSNIQSLEAQEFEEPGKETPKPRRVLTAVNESTCLDGISKLMKTPAVKPVGSVRKSRRSEVNTFVVKSPTTVPLRESGPGGDTSLRKSRRSEVNTFTVKSPTSVPLDESVLEVDASMAVSETTIIEDLSNIQSPEAQEFEEPGKETPKPRRILTAVNESTCLDGVSNLMNTPAVRSARSLRKSRRSEVNTFEVDSPISVPLGESEPEADTSMAASETTMNGNISIPHPLKGPDFEKTSTTRNDSLAVNESVCLDGVSNLMKTPAVKSARSVRKSRRSEVNTFDVKSPKTVPLGESGPEANTSIAASETSMNGDVSITQSLEASELEEKTSRNDSFSVNESVCLDGVSNLLKTPAVTSARSLRKSRRSEVNTFEIKSPTSVTLGESGAEGDTNVAVSETTMNGEFSNIQSLEASELEQSTKKSNVTKNDLLSVNESVCLDGVSNLMNTPVVKSARSLRKSRRSEISAFEAKSSTSDPLGESEADTSMAFSGTTVNGEVSITQSLKGSELEQSTKKSNTTGNDSLAVNESVCLGGVSNILKTPAAAETTTARNDSLFMNESVCLDGVSNLMNTPTVRSARSLRKSRRSDVNTIEVKSPTPVSVGKSGAEEDTNMAVCEITMNGENGTIQSLKGQEFQEQTNSTPKTSNNSLVVNDSVCLDGVSNLLNTPAVTSARSLRKSRRSELNTLDVKSRISVPLGESGVEDTSMAVSETNSNGEFSNTQSLEGQQIEEHTNTKNITINDSLAENESLCLDGVSNLLKTPAVSSTRILRKSRSSEVNTLVVKSPLSVPFGESVPEANSSMGVTDTTINGDISTMQSLEASELKETTTTRNHTFSVNESVCLDGIGNLMKTPAISSTRSLRKYRKSEVNARQSLETSGLEETTTTINDSFAVNGSVCLDGVSNLLNTPLVTSARSLRKSRKSEVNTFEVKSLTSVPLGESRAEGDTNVAVSETTMNGENGTIQSLKGQELEEQTNSTPKTSNNSLAVNESVCLDGVSNLFNTPAVKPTRSLRKLRRSEINTFEVKSPLLGHLEKSKLESSMADPETTLNAGISAIQSPEYLEFEEPRIETPKPRREQTAMNESICLDGVSNLMKTPAVRSPRSLRKTRRSEVNTFIVKSPTTVPLRESGPEGDTSMAVSETTMHGDISTIQSLEASELEELTKETSKNGYVLLAENESICLDGVSNLMKTPAVRSVRSVRKSRRSEVNTFGLKSPTSVQLEESVLEANTSMVVTDTAIKGSTRRVRKSRMSEVNTFEVKSPASVTLGESGPEADTSMAVSETTMKGVISTIQSLETQEFEEPRMETPNPSGVLTAENESLCLDGVSNLMKTPAVRSARSVRKSRRSEVNTFGIKSPTSVPGDSGSEVDINMTSAVNESNCLDGVSNLMQTPGVTFTRNQSRAISVVNTPKIMSQDYEHSCDITTSTPLMKPLIKNILTDHVLNNIGSSSSGSCDSASVVVGKENVNGLNSCLEENNVDGGECDHVKEEECVSEKESSPTERNLRSRLEMEASSFCDNSKGRSFLGESSWITSSTFSFVRTPENSNLKENQLDSSEAVVMSVERGNEHPSSISRRPDFHGIKELFSANNLLSDSENVCGVKELMNQKSPVSRYSDFQGLRKLFNHKSPVCTYENISGVAELFNESHESKDSQVTVINHTLSEKSGEESAYNTKEMKKLQCNPVVVLPRIDDKILKQVSVNLALRNRNSGQVEGDRIDGYSHDSSKTSVASSESPCIIVKKQKKLPLNSRKEILQQSSASQPVSEESVPRTRRTKTSASKANAVADEIKSSDQSGKHRGQKSLEEDLNLENAEPTTRTGRRVLRRNQPSSASEESEPLSKRTRHVSDSKDDGSQSSQLQGKKGKTKSKPNEDQTKDEIVEATSSTERRTLRRDKTANDSEKAQPQKTRRALGHKCEERNSNQPQEKAEDPKSNTTKKALKIEETEVSADTLKPKRRKNKCTSISEDSDMGSQTTRPVTDLSKEEDKSGEAQEQCKLKESKAAVKSVHFEEKKSPQGSGRRRLRGNKCESQQVSEEVVRPSRRTKTTVSSADTVGSEVKSSEPSEKVRGKKSVEEEVKLENVEPSSSTGRRALRRNQPSSASEESEPLSKRTRHVIDSKDDGSQSSQLQGKKGKTKSKPNEDQTKDEIVEATSSTERRTLRRDRTANDSEKAQPQKTRRALGHKCEERNSSQPQEKAEDPKSNTSKKALKIKETEVSADTLKPKRRKNKCTSISEDSDMGSQTTRPITDLSKEEDKSGEAQEQCKLKESKAAVKSVHFEEKKSPQGSGRRRLRGNKCESQQVSEEIVRPSRRIKTTVSSADTVGSEVKSSEPSEKVRGKKSVEEDVKLENVEPSSSTGRRALRRNQPSSASEESEPLSKRTRHVSDSKDDGSRSSQLQGKKGKTKSKPNEDQTKDEIVEATSSTERRTLRRDRTAKATVGDENIKEQGNKNNKGHKKNKEAILAAPLSVESDGVNNETKSAGPKRSSKTSVKSNKSKQDLKESERVTRNKSADKERSDGKENSSKKKVPNENQEEKIARRVTRRNKALK